MPTSTMVPAAALRTASTTKTLLQYDTLASWCLAACVTFNFGLCFIDTNVAALSRVHVIGAELLLVGSALLLAMARWTSAMTSWLVFLFSAFVWWAVLSLIRQDVDLKLVRDVIIIPIFVMLGLSTSLGHVIKTAVYVHVFILLAMLFEGLFPSAFQGIFNIAKYYVDTRGFDQSSFWNEQSTLFLSATRPDQRYIMPFLNIHRLSSVFLEPVSLGNYVIIFTLFLLAFRERIRPRLFWMLALANAVLLVGSDGRLASLLCALLVLGYWIVDRLPRSGPVFILPLVVLFIFIVVNALGFQGGSDDLPGRVAYTVELLESFDVEDVFGMSTRFLGAAADSGIAYMVVSQSVLGVTAVWLFTFGLKPSPDRPSMTLRYGAAFYCATTLTVSFSIFSLKTAALLWFLYGAASKTSASWTGSAKT